MEAQALTITTRNLLKETEEALAAHNLGIKNVKGVCVSTGFIPIAEFVSKASQITYELKIEGFVIDPTLKLIGACWWYERCNNGVGEHWEFRKKPAIPKVQAKNCNLRVREVTQDAIQRV